MVISKLSYKDCYCNNRILPPIRGSLPEVIRSCCHHHLHHHKVLRRPFERARHAHAPPTALRRRVAGAPAARDLGAAATPLARRPLAMSHRTGAPLERGGGRWQQGPRGVPPHPRPRQELEARLAPSLSSSAQLHTTSSTSPLPPGGNVRSYAGGTCRRPGAQHFMRHTTVTSKEVSQVLN